MSNSIHKLTNRHRESGAALLIAIFALMLISVVAIALVVSQGTDSALAGNYRTSTSAYYAALAGLEEGRGRLLGRNPNFIGKTVNNFVPTQGTPLDVHTVLYVVNPASSETVNTIPNLLLGT
jgi:type II secretory pathway component PulK